MATMSNWIPYGTATDLQRTHQTQRGQTSHITHRAAHCPRMICIYLCHFFYTHISYFISSLLLGILGLVWKTTTPQDYIYSFTHSAYGIYHHTTHCSYLHPVCSPSRGGTGIIFLYLSKLAAFSADKIQINRTKKYK